MKHIHDRKILHRDIKSQVSKYWIKKLVFLVFGKFLNWSKIELYLSVSWMLFKNIKNADRLQLGVVCHEELSTWTYSFSFIDSVLSDGPQCIIHSQGIHSCKRNGRWMQKFRNMSEESSCSMSALSFLPQGKMIYDLVWFVKEEFSIKIKSLLMQISCRTYFWQQVEQSN